MTDFPVVLTTAVDNTTDALAKHLNNLEAKVGINQSAVTTSLDYWMRTGWVSGLRTWVYVGIHSFKIEGVDVTSEFPKGTKIRYKQGGDFEYGTVVLSAFSTDTTITMATNSNYELAEAAITDNYYSLASSPIGFPNYFSWTPVLDGFSTNPSVSTYTFSLNGTVCYVEISQGGDGTSDATNFTITLPISFGGVGDVWGACGFTKDNGANLAGAGYRISAASSTLVTIYSDMTTGAWTASGAKRTRLATSYII